MRVEIDISDIPIGSFYTDERSKRIEMIIRDKEEYVQFIVKRYRGQEDPSHDGYIVMDETENAWVWMYEWEVDVLNDAEIMSYVTVTKETSQRPDPTENWMIISSLFAALFITFLILLFIPDFPPIYDFIIGTMLVFLGGTVITGWMYRGKYRAHKQSEKEFEIATMTRHPLFLESIRKFAALENISESQSEIYLERIQEIESKMVD